MEGIVRDLGLFYTDTSSTTTPAKRVVVFIHGFPFNHTMWSPQAVALQSSHRVITYDQRGHGKTPLAHPYLFESLVDDLFGILDHLQIQKAVLCGLSMGGYVALRAMERNPERIEALVLCDTKSESDTDAARLNRSKDLVAIREKGLNAFASAFARRVLAPGTIQTNPTLVSVVEKMISQNPVDGTQAALVALATRTDTTESLAKIRVPTLILVGEHDALTPVKNAQFLQTKIPDSKITIVPEAGHMSNLENSSLFNASFVPFITNLPQ